MIAGTIPGSCAGSRTESTVNFSSIVMRLDFLMIELVHYDLTIDLRAWIVIHNRTVSIRKDGKAAVLNFVHESETWAGSSDDFTTDSETETGEDSDKRDYSSFLFTLEEYRYSSLQAEEIDATQAKYEHFSEECAV